MSSDEKLADALFALMNAGLALTEAKRNVPSYTGQHSPKDFYEDEEKAYLEAAAAYAEAVREVCRE